MARPDPDEPNDSAGSTDPDEPRGPVDPLASPRARKLVLGAFAVIAILGGLLFAFDRSNQGAWGCRSLAVDDAAAVGPTARDAVDRFAATGAAPGDGWEPSEPNRFARTQEGIQMLISVNQSEPNIFTVVRLDTCGPGILPTP